MRNFLSKNFGDFKLLIRYGISGVAAIVANIITLYVMTSMLGLWYIWSDIIAIGVSICVGFILQKYWTFRGGAATGRVRKEMANYFLVAVGGNFLGLFLLYVLTSMFGMWYLFSQVIGLGIVAVLSFLVNKNVTFQST